MRNSATQNPSNKVGRNSGAGPGGVSRIVPTQQEARRGLEPLQVRGGRSWLRPLGMGLSALALLGMAGYAARQRQRKHSFRSRLEDLVRW